MALTSAMVAGFTTKYLAARYDDAVAVPKFHRDMWDDCCSSHPKVCEVTPRGHGKSTAITHAYVLANVLFREEGYVLIVSDTEDQAKEFLGDIKMELQENLELCQDFQIAKFVKDAETEIIVQFLDGARFRIRALGAEQRVRGRKWRGKRPGLIVGDDLEGDEQVESDLRREKFRKWFFNALVPALAKGGKIRIVGTILHMDSLLCRLLKNPSWKSRSFKAHKSFDDFSEILWPEYRSEEWLREQRQEKIDEQMPESYSQEYLNNPIDQAQAFFRESDFLPMELEHFNLNKNYYAAIDFAISDDKRADYTAIVVGGMDQFGILHIVHSVRGRWDAKEIIDEMIAVQKRYHIELWKAEEGAIKKTLLSELERRMQEEQCFMNIVPGVPTKDKRTRARPIQARMRAGGERFNKDADWWPTFYEEHKHFPKGEKKDLVDAHAWLGIALRELNEAASPQETEMDDYEQMVQQSEHDYGQSYITGY